jgi:hypothetical protein
MLGVDVGRCETADGKTEYGDNPSQLDFLSLREISSGSIAPARTAVASVTRYNW